MKKYVKILLTIIISIMALIIMQNKVEAKSYYIKNMDIQATIQDTGDVLVEQTMEYSFSGSYNGIYIDIPYKFEHKELDNSKLNDNYYNGQNIELQSVQQITNNGDVDYRRVNSASNGNSGVYTRTDLNNICQIKVYSPSTNINKKFKITYIINNLCVKHNDVGELYYNFIGGEWECTIKNLNIDIWLPNNSEEMKIWGHGPDNGTSKIVSNSHANFKVINVPTGKYVATRVVFDKSNIANSTKLSNINALDLIMQDEHKISKVSDAKLNFTRNIIIFAIILLIYWVILLFRYEKDKKYLVAEIDEDYLLEKYNPVLAGCLQGSRDILARDIIAVILNLIDKNYIKLEIKQTLSKKENYTYYITKVPEQEENMDKIEKYVYDWVFGINGVQVLENRLKNMPKEKDANEKFKKLNNIVQEELKYVGANQAKVPKLLRVVNTLIFVLSIFLVFKHITNQGLEIYSESELLLIFIPLMFYVIPLFMIVIYIPIALIVAIRHNISRLVEKITGQRVVTTTVTIIVISVIIIITTYLTMDNNRYLIADELLLCIATIIMLTDNLMLKNNVLMIEDFSKINTFKYKLEEYTMMEDRDIEQITLWGKYLSYAVSFGIAEKITKRIKGLNLDDDLTKLLDDRYNFADFIYNDYSYFYIHASLDRRFMKSYMKTTGKLFSAIGSRW